jgi:hypothetical protein
LSYTGEQWRRAQSTSSSGPERLRVLYSATSATDGFVYMGTAFDFTAPQDASGQAEIALDGNAAANRTVISGVFTLPALLPQNAPFWIRWHDWNDNATYDHFLAVDDVSVVPEPGTLAMLAGAGLVGLVLIWRRRK